MLMLLTTVRIRPLDGSTKVLGFVIQFRGDSFPKSHNSLQNLVAGGPCLDLHSILRVLQCVRVTAI